MASARWIRRKQYPSPSPQRGEGTEENDTPQGDGRKKKGLRPPLYFNRIF